mmetsp:Transcript_91776/g.264687  ORF Transcript_91776/g.264687 Transcript_91776/m.264687 type:complete len:214 (+) Transcript_91776:1314-1955(+)
MVGADAPVLRLADRAAYSCRLQNAVADPCARFGAGIESTSRLRHSELGSRCTVRVSVAGGSAGAAPAWLIHEPDLLACARAWREAPHLDQPSWCLVRHERHRPRRDDVGVSPSACVCGRARSIRDCSVGRPAPPCRHFRRGNLRGLRRVPRLHILAMGRHDVVVQRVVHVNDALVASLESMDDPAHVAPAVSLRDELVAFARVCWRYVAGPIG